MAKIAKTATMTTAALVTAPAERDDALAAPRPGSACPRRASSRIRLTTKTW